jgi:hypothetical protein
MERTRGAEEHHSSRLLIGPGLDESGRADFFADSRGGGVPHPLQCLPKDRSSQVRRPSPAVPGTTTYRAAGDPGRSHGGGKADVQAGDRPIVR